MRLEQEYGPPKVQTWDPGEGRRLLDKDACTLREAWGRLKIFGATGASARTKLRDQS